MVVMNVVPELELVVKTIAVEDGRDALVKRRGSQNRGRGSII
jgi:hypothetical protein